MANPEHVEIVKRGAEAIGKWRVEHPDAVLDLTNADLVALNLRRADLNRANFRGAKLNSGNLRLAELNGANLRGADLSAADFFYAQLSGALLNDATLDGAEFNGAYLVSANMDDVSFSGDISDANLSGASLRRANLANADLRSAILTGADMCDANLNGAKVAWTTFGNLDLSRVQGLDNVKHIGPCTVGVDTLYKSRGKIPAEFLRGCGVPDGQIEYLPSLLGMQKAVEFYSCFISYSHQDEEFCKRLHSRMRDEHLRVWYAPEDMAGGKKLHEQIDDAIHLHDKLLIVLSDKSMSSEWVKTEVRKARKREETEGKRVLFPIRLVSFDAIRDWEAFDADTGKDMAAELREYFIPDFSNWKDHDEFEKSFQRLLNDLNKDDEAS